MSAALTTNYSLTATTGTATTGTATSAITAVKPATAMSTEHADICISILRGQISTLESELESKTKAWKAAINSNNQEHNKITASRQPNDKAFPLYEKLLNQKEAIVVEQDTITFYLLTRIEALRQGIKTLTTASSTDLSQTKVVQISAVTAAASTTASTATAASAPITSQQDVKSAAAYDISSGGYTPSPYSLVSTTQKIIFIYNGTGAKKFCVDAMTEALKVNVDPAQVTIATFDHNCSFSHFDTENHFMVLPGGNYLDQHRALFGDNSRKPHAEAQKRLVEFFKQGRVLGSCAGAALMTHCVPLFAGRLAFNCMPDWGYIPVLAGIPLDPLDNYANDKSNPVARNVKMITFKGQTFASSHTQGPWFVRTNVLRYDESQKYDSTETLVTYSDHLRTNAIYASEVNPSTKEIETDQEPYEDGELPGVVVWRNWQYKKLSIVVLTGVHPEITAEALKTLIPTCSGYHLSRLQNVIKMLSGKHAIRQNKLLFRLMIETLGIPMKPLADQ